LQAKVAMLHEIIESQRCKKIAGRMSVHVIADRPNKLSDLRSMLEPQYRVSCALLEDASEAAEEFDAVVVAADLRIIKNIKRGGPELEKNAQANLFD
jgi:hypothetical protein